MKLGRNKPCWCGSNIKYKHCHLNRSQQTPLQRSLLHKEQNRFNTDKKCSAPSVLHDKCSKKIVKAHSISKSSSLKEIAVDGHVLTFFMAQRSKSNTNLEPIKVGINKASIFNGFCGNHDKELFSPFEDQPFDSSSYHCFLIMFRTLSRELFIKESAKGTFGLIKEMDRGKDLDFQEYIQERYQHLNGNNDLTISDLKYMKASLDKMFISKEYDNLDHLIIELNSPPSVMASAIAGVNLGFDGSLIQEISQDPQCIPDYLCINSLSSDGKGYIILSWLTEHKVSNQQLIRTLMDSHSIPDSLLMLVISRIENIYISPLWWDKLSNQNRLNLIELYKSDGVQDTYYDALMTTVDYGAFDYKCLKYLYNEQRA